MGGGGDLPNMNGFKSLVEGIVNMIEAPVTWFKGKLSTGHRFRRLWCRLHNWKAHNLNWQFVDCFPLSESVVTPNQKQYPWYHQNYRRVPTIDQCYTDDQICRFEADQQFKRDRLVDSEVLSILRSRFEDCMLYEGPDNDKKCMPLYEIYQKGAENWFTKCKQSKTGL